MKSTVALITILHGIIHLVGFVKSFNLFPISQLTQNIPKVQGILWLFAALLFVLCAVLQLLKKDLWLPMALLAVSISQGLILLDWHDAKFGTLVNIIILIASIVGIGTWHFYRKYMSEVATLLNQSGSPVASVLTESDIQHLPEPVRKYLSYTGALGKPKVSFFKVEFSGQIRKNEKSEWMPFTSEQYNSINPSTRLFFMKATMKHLPVAGFHSFKNGSAFMDIRLFSLFNVQFQSGKEMSISETVTFFNDMSCMAPATLIDPRIKWIEVSHHSVGAEFTNNNIMVSATLYFNDDGALINFISGDRYASREDNIMKRLPWSTPLKDYKIINGHRLAGYADAIYQYPEKELCYGQFLVTNIQYNREIENH